MRKEIKINRGNYEVFVVDFIDGNLSPDETAVFMKFLEKHPDIEEEVRGLSEISITGAPDTYKEKTILKKQEIASVNNITESNYEEAFFAYHEGDMVDSEKIDVEKFLGLNPQLKEEFTLHSNLYVKPDTAIIYNNKLSLRKRTYYIPASVWSAAAVIILLLGWWFTTSEDGNIQRQQSTINTILAKSTGSIPSANYTESNIPVRYSKAIETDIIEGEDYQRETFYFTSLSTRKFDGNSLGSYDYTNILDQKTDYKIYLVTADDSNLDNSAADIKKKSLFASIVSNQWKKLTGSVSEINTTPTKPDDPTYVRVIDQSIKVFNTITGSETLTSKTYNSEGELTGYQVEGRELLLSRNANSGSVE